MILYSHDTNTNKNNEKKEQEWQMVYDTIIFGFFHSQASLVQQVFTSSTLEVTFQPISSLFHWEICR